MNRWGSTRAGDNEFQAVWQKADQTLRDATAQMLLTGLRPADALKIKGEDLRDSAFGILQNKTKLSVILPPLGCPLWLAEDVDLSLSGSATYTAACDNTVRTSRFEST